VNWKVKSRIQNLIAKFPSHLSYTTYYLFQRHWGGLRKTDPTSRLIAGIKIVDYIYKQGQTAISKTFLEIGTGYQLNLPISLWLCGARKIITVDLNRYLKAELIFENISYIQNHQQEIKTLFENVPNSSIFEQRFDQLINATKNLQSLLEMMNIEYLAPADATQLDLKPHTIDYYVSYTVLEHIPSDTLKSTLLEGKRLLKKRGLFIHCIDFSDHFSHSDRSISPINFLQYNDSQWERFAGNRYMYHNRMQIDNFMDLFRKANLKILNLDPAIDEESLETLKRGFQLDSKFKNKSIETIATSSAWFVATYQ